MDKCREAAGGADLVGMFDCMGELSEQVADFLVKSADPIMRSFGERRGETLGNRTRPDCNGPGNSPQRSWVRRESFNELRG